MEYYSSQISQLVEQLASLPGIGAKTAQRLAFHIIDMPEERVEKLADSIVKAKKTIRYCKECLTLTDRNYVLSAPILRETTKSLWWWRIREI